MAEKLYDSLRDESPLQPSTGQKDIKEPLVQNFMLVLAAMEFSTVDLGGLGGPGGGLAAMPSRGGRNPRRSSTA